MSALHFKSHETKYNWISTFSDGMIHIPNINEDNLNYLFNCDSDYRIYKIEYVIQLVHLKQLPPNWFSKPVPNFNNDSWVRRSFQPNIKPNKDKIYLAELKNPLKFTFADADEIMNTTNVSMWLNDEDFYPLFKDFIPDMLREHCNINRNK